MGVLHPLICRISDVLLREKMAMQSGLHAGMEIVSDHILIRRPAIPRWWDPNARPHVAIVIDNPEMGRTERIYLSRTGHDVGDGRTTLEVAEIDKIASNLSDGAVLEVRFSATKANLYQLEMVGAAACWRWINRSQGLQSFETDSSDWNYRVDSSLDPNSYLFA